MTGGLARSSFVSVRVLLCLFSVCFDYMFSSNIYKLIFRQKVRCATDLPTLVLTVKIVCNVIEGLNADFGLKVDSKAPWVSKVVFSRNKLVLAVVVRFLFPVLRTKCFIFSNGYSVLLWLK